MPQKRFNWSGISENDDGTYTTKGKIEKKRLLKSLHESRIKVRSRRNEDGSWTVTPVGSMRPKKVRTLRAIRVRVPRDEFTGEPIRQNAGGYPSSPRQPGRYVPLARPVRYGRGGSRPQVYHIPGAHGPGVTSTLWEWKKQKMIQKQKQQDALIKARKEQAITEEKMRKEREESERKQQEKAARHAMFKAHRESSRDRMMSEQAAQHESDRLKQQRKAEFDASRQERHEQIRAREQQAERQRVYEESSRQAAIDSARLQAERERQVSSE